MRNIFKPFTTESFITALGITLIISLISPVIKEIINPIKHSKKGIISLDEQKEKMFMLEKERIK